jgi:hypothetical protein
MDAAARLSAGRVGQAGQGLVEYAIILSLIAGLAIGVAFFVGGRMKGELSTVGGSVAAAVSHGGNTGGGNTGGGNTGGGNTGGGNSGGTGVDPTSACATSTLGATAAPLHMVILFDRSGSMCEFDANLDRDCTNKNSKWIQATDAIKTFVSSPDARGIKASLVMFPFADNSNQMCTSSKYSTALVNDITLPDSTQIGPMLDSHVSNSGQTPTKDALTGAIALAQTIQTANPKDKVAIVLATDGIPQGCSDANNPTPAANAAKAVASTIPTYVIGVGDQLSSLDAIAAAGGTTKAFTASTSTPSQTGAALSAAFATIRGATMSCNFNIPAAPAGQTLDYAKVNVQVTTKGTPGTIPHSQDCTDPTGWKYDNEAAPTQIELCSSACTGVKADAYSSVNLILGCTTQQSTAK